MQLNNKWLNSRLLVLQVRLIECYNLSSSCLLVISFWGCNSLWMEWPLATLWKILSKVSTQTMICSKWSGASPSKKPREIDRRIKLARQQSISYLLLKSRRSIANSRKCSLEASEDPNKLIRILNLLPVPYAVSIFFLERRVCSCLVVISIILNAWSLGC